jgi:hypothetical protein
MEPVVIVGLSAGKGSTCQPAGRQPAAAGAPARARARTECGGSDAKPRVRARPASGAARAGSSLRQRVGQSRRARRRSRRRQPLHVAARGAPPAAAACAASRRARAAAGAAASSAVHAQAARLHVRWPASPAACRSAPCAAAQACHSCRRPRIVARSGGQSDVFAHASIHADDASLATPRHAASQAARLAASATGTRLNVQDATHETGAARARRRRWRAVCGGGVGRLRRHATTLQAVAAASLGAASTSG